MKYLIRSFSAVLFLLLSTLVSANVMVYPMTVKINPESPSKNQFKIFSKSDKTQYLKVYVAQVIDPATPKEHETPISIMSGTGIVASPQRIILPPGGEHTVRLRSLSTPNKETAYRVYIEPVTAEDSVDGKGGDANIDINVTWGVLVISPPKNPESNLSVDIKSGKLENKGNIHTWVKDISLCSGNTSDTCQKTKIEKSIYPDLSMSLPSTSFTIKSIVVHYRTQDSDIKSQHWSF